MHPFQNGSRVPELVHYGIILAAQGPLSQGRQAVAMRIIFSNFDDINNPFYGGGGAKGIHEVAKRLSARHEVTVLTAKYPGCKTGIIDGVNYERIGMLTGPKFGQIVFHFALIKEIKRRSYDIWVESSTPPFSTFGYQMLTRKPVVFLAMNLSGRDMAAKYHVPMHWVENLGLKAYRHAIGVTQTMRREMLKANPRINVAVIPNGVDQSLIDQPAAENGNYILFLGRIDIRHKGLDLLLEAYKTIESKTNVPLVIAGAGLEKDERFLKQKIKELKLENRIRCLGKVTGTAKDDAFRNAMFYTAPSRCEGVPLAIMEAASYGLPVALFSIDDLAWMPDSISLKAKPYDVAEYGRNLLTLATNAPVRRRLSQSAKDWIRSFSWDSLAEQYEKFLIDAANR